MIKPVFIQAARMVARVVKLSAMAATLTAVAGVLVSSRIPTMLETVKQEGKLHMISRNGPTPYYEVADGKLTGFEYSIAKRFAKYLGVELVVHEQEDLGLMLNEVRDQKVHFAAAGLTVTAQRQQKVKFAAPYLEVTQQLIYRYGTKRPKSIDDLVGKKMMVIGNSSHSERLRKLQRVQPKLNWDERHDLDMLDLLEMVHKGEVDYVVVDSNAYEMNAALYPKAQVAFDISDGQSLAWAFPSEKDSSLYDEAQKFFANINEAGIVADTFETYYGHLGELNYSGALLFSHRIDSRLPKWEDKLRNAAKKYDLDWQLLAALSYQESHWNPKAKSPTGVRGFMMLTLNTAKEVGVKNRLNADQSIMGGAKYFKSIHSRIPARILEPDRSWLAMAAYNVGYGHLEDARILTEHFGGNPDKWADVKDNLLLLAKRKYYKSTKHGYARGWEAVEYVQNIRNFHTIIAWNEKEKQQLLAAADKLEQKDFAQFSPVMTEAVKTIATKAL